MDAKPTTLTLVDKLHFQGLTPSGVTLDLDSPLDESARAGASPMELQLLALGGCGAMDTISILRKMRQYVTGYEVSLTHERAADHPRVFTSITITHVIRGRNLAPSMVRRAVALPMARYCPVFAMLNPSVPITERYEITDEATGATTSGAVSLEEAQAEAGG
jgi:putative redox protein